MRTLEIRRHAHRKHGGGSQLSQQGVTLARELGNSLGPFHSVVTTVVPRARETAIAMGFAVDQEIVTLSNDEDAHAEMAESKWWEADLPLQALARMVLQKGALWRYGSSIAALWRDCLTPLSDGGSVLFIGHSGELEVALICCFPDAHHGAWGGAFGPLEGARLSFEGDQTRFSRLEILRTASLH